MSLILTNIEQVPGRRIVQHFGLVQGSTIRAKHFGRDFAAGLKKQALAAVYAQQKDRAAAAARVRWYRVSGRASLQDSSADQMVSGRGRRGAGSSRPWISADEARAAAEAYLDPWRVSREWGKPEKTYLALMNGGAPGSSLGYRYQPAWAVKVEVDGDGGSWEVLVDAHSDASAAERSDELREQLRRVASLDERRERIEARKAVLREEMNLAELRQALSLTQNTLAEALGVGQAEISKIENRADVFVSTLRNFLTAMGGELEIRAVFPDHAVTIKNFSSLVTEKAEERP